MQVINESHLVATSFRLITVELQATAECLVEGGEGEKSSLPKLG